MILDERTEFCDNQALNTGAAATYNIGDQIDLGLAGRGIGQPGQELYLVLQVGATGINAAGAGTLQFQLASDDSATLATNGTQSVHAVSRSFTTSTTSGNAGNALQPGTVLAVFQLPIEGTVYERYLGVQQITGTQAITAGTVDAFLTQTPRAWKAYEAPWQG